MTFRPWQAATRCTSGPRPGAEALMRWIMEEYGSKGAMNWGIFNCRDVRGGSTTSCHGEGRAGDTGFAVGDPDADDLLRRLIRHAWRLGIQCIIYERVIYSAKSPNGRPYTGVASHHDHIHWELTRAAGERLTYATVKEVLARKPRKPGQRNLRQGCKGADVRWVQRHLKMRDVDGIYGRHTADAVEAFERGQRKRYPNIQVDGVVGTLTWKAMGVTPDY